MWCGRYRKRFDSMDTCAAYDFRGYGILTPLPVCAKCVHSVSVPDLQGKLKALASAVEQAILDNRWGDYAAVRRGLTDALAELDKEE